MLMELASATMQLDRLAEAAQRCQECLQRPPRSTGEAERWVEAAERLGSLVEDGLQVPVTPQARRFGRQPRQRLSPPPSLLGATALCTFRSPPQCSPILNGCSVLEGLVVPVAGMVSSMAAASANDPATQLRLSHVYSAFRAAGLMLHVLLQLCRDGQLQLADADTLRLIAAVSEKLRAQQLLLSRLLQGPHSQPVAAAAEVALAGASAGLFALTRLLAAEVSSGLPHRALAAARATSLRPEALLERCCQLAAAADAMLARWGLDSIPMAFFEAMDSFLASSASSDPPLPEATQAALLRVANATLSSAATESLAEQLAAREGCIRLCAACCIAASSQLVPARTRQERASGPGLLRLLGRLLQQALRHAAARPATCSEQPLAVLVLARAAADIARDVMEIDCSGATGAARLEGVVVWLGEPGGGLHLLRQLLKQVAAADPSQLPPGQQPPSLQAIWRQPASLQPILHSWLGLLQVVRCHLSLGPVLPSSAAAMAAASAAGTLVDLAALLPDQPCEVPGSGVGATGTAAPASNVLLPSPSKDALQQLTFEAEALAADLCIKLDNSSAHISCGSVAGALFSAAMAACKAEWAVAGGAFLSSAKGGRCPPLFHSATSAALRACMHQQETHAAADAQRRIECLALCYLEALSANPSYPSTDEVATEHQAVALGRVCRQSCLDQLLLPGERHALAGTVLRTASDALRHAEGPKCIDQCLELLEAAQQRNLLPPALPALEELCSMSADELAQTVQRLMAILPPEPAAGSAPSRELAARRAHALALRSCANPRCANLSSHNEAAAKGRLCTGCQVVRFCSEACSRAAWRQAGGHKLACRLLCQQRQQEAQQQQQQQQQRA